ncbi:MAG: SDR family oxidoreductase [bacterium]
MNLSKKTVLITGASRGIGKVLATSLAGEWAELILVARSLPHLRALAKTLPGKHTLIAADLSTNQGLAKVIRLVKRKHKSLDILINNAGIGHYKPFTTIGKKDWDSSYHLNVTTPFFLSQALLPLLQKAENSAVINIGSCSALQAKATRSLYNSTKAALRTSTLCLAAEYKGKSPDFCVITLDSTFTSFGPLTIEQKAEKTKKGKTYLQPEWVAKQILEIIKSEYRDQEYVLSPQCYEECGTWCKP